MVSPASRFGGLAAPSGDRRHPARLRRWRGRRRSGTAAAGHTVGMVSRRLLSGGVLGTGVGSAAPTPALGPGADQAGRADRYTAQAHHRSCAASAGAAAPDRRQEMVAFPWLTFGWQTIEPAPIVLQTLAEFEHLGAICPLLGDPADLRFREGPAASLFPSNWTCSYDMGSSAGRYWWRTCRERSSLKSPVLPYMGSVPFCRDGLGRPCLSAQDARNAVLRQKPTRKAQRGSGSRFATNIRSRDRNEGHRSIQRWAGDTAGPSRAPCRRAPVY